MTIATVSLDDGHVYAIGRLNAKQQFHVTRRLLPAVAALGAALGSFQMLAAEASRNEAKMMEVVAGPVTDIIAKMSDTDVDYVLDTCLSVVSRAQADGRYAMVMVRGQLMFADMKMLVMVRLAVEVIKENCSDFFSAALSGQSLSAN